MAEFDIFKVRGADGFGFYGHWAFTDDLALETKAPATHS